MRSSRLRGAIYTVMALGLALGLAPAAQAQTPVTAIAQLDVELWPDYDQPAVLVLLTLQLPATVSLADPHTLVIPLPADATLNAVARYGDDGNLYADLTYTPDVGLQTLTIITPSPRLRVEYYYPYQAEGLTRHLTFAWQSALEVAAFNVSVQQPAAATSMTLSPPGEVTQAANGLTYHLLPGQALSAGQAFTLEASYTLATAQLTAETPNPAAASNRANPAAPQDQTTGYMPWVLVGAAAAGLAGLSGWWWARSATPRQPRRQRAAPEAQATRRFCPHCGAPVRLSSRRSRQAGDKFCSQCGTALR